MKFEEIKRRIKEYRANPFLYEDFETIMPVEIVERMFNVCLRARKLSVIDYHYACSQCVITSQIAMEIEDAITNLEKD